MPTCMANKGTRLTMTVRVDKRPYLAGFQTPPNNSTWENIQPDPDGMGETREFVMPSTSGDTASFNGQFDEQVQSTEPSPQATYAITFNDIDGQVCADRVVVPQGAGPVSREYVFTSQ